MSKSITILFYDVPYSFDESENITQPTYKRSLQSDWTLTQIEELLDIEEEYSIEILEGEKINFIDFYCHSGSSEIVIDRIKSIPASCKESLAEGFRYIRGQFYEDEPESPLPNKNVTVHYRYNYSRGAGSFCDWVLLGSNNPWVMLVVGYVFSKALDYLGGVIKKGKRPIRAAQPLLNTKKLYTSAAKLLGCNTKDLQIDSLKQKDIRIYKIRLRDKNGDRYDAECYSNGKILKIDTKKCRNRKALK